MKYNYDDYKNRAEAGTSTQTNSNLPNVKFVSDFLKKDGDFLVVRFPYHSTKDITIEHCHEVSWPGMAYSQKVECTKDTGTCILCDQKAKTVNRFLVKAIAYITNPDGTVSLTPVVWDRPTSYADELKTKMSEYGDLTENLFKIKRNGVGQVTTYSTDIIINKAVYDPAIYKNDLSLLEETHADRLLVRRMSKYLEVTKAEKGEEKDSEPAQTAVGTSTSAMEAHTTPGVEQPLQATPQEVHQNTYRYNPNPGVETRTTQTQETVNPAFNRPKRVE